MFKLTLGADAWLEKVETRHAEAFYQATAPVHAQLSRFLAVSETEDEFRAWIAGQRDRDAGDGGFACGIWQGGSLVGMISLYELSRHYLSATLACWMIPDGRGQGLASKATRAMTSYAFEALLLERVVIRVATENQVSQRIPERLGFQFEGVARAAEIVGDAFIDVVVYAMRAGEWQEARMRRDRYPARPPRQEDAGWMEGIPSSPLVGGGAGVRVALVVEGEAVAEAELAAPLATLTRLGAVPGAEGAVLALLPLLEGELRRGGASMLRAAVGPERAAALMEILVRAGFVAVGDGILCKAIGDLAAK